MSSDFFMQCFCYYNTRTSSSSTYLSSISLDTHSSAFISLLKRKYCTRLVSPSKISHKLHREYVTQAQLLAHLFWATCLPWVTDLNGYNIQSNWNSHRGSDFFLIIFIYHGSSPNRHSCKCAALLMAAFTKLCFSQLPYKLCIVTFP